MPLVPNEISVDERFATRLPDPGPVAFVGLVEDVGARGILVDLLVTQDGLLLTDTGDSRQREGWDWRRFQSSECKSATATRAGRSLRCSASTFAVVR